MSQSTLAEELGLSFQQVQKYEKGVNRIPAGRLKVIADILQVPVMFLYGQSAASNEVDSLLMIDPSFTLRLLRAYGAIKDVEVARKLVEVMERIAAAY
jgi:transcriptional regulator with XRE-family HTH domain